MVVKASTCYINLLKERGSSLFNLKEFLKLDTGDNYNKAISLLSKNRQLKKVLYERLFPKALDIYWPKYLEELSLAKILLWYCNLIANHNESICEFEKRKMRFEQLFLAGKYDEAYELIDEIRKKFGLSLWLLDCYGLLVSFGLENKDIEDTLDDNALNWYKIMTMKNRTNERQQQYIYRINH